MKKELDKVKKFEINHAGSAYHAFWVTQLATTGIIGILILSYFIYLISKIDIPFIPIIFVPVFIGFFDNTLFHPFVLFLLILAYFLIFENVQSQNEDIAPV
ncbi:MAG: hypothetical protein U0525_04930 [Patescibacteria group bacterium]